MSAAIDSQPVDTQGLTDTNSIPPRPPRTEAAAHIRHYWMYVADATEVAEKKLLFLAGLKERGVIKAGLLAADIGRGTAYLWRNIDPEFKREWDEIRENAHDEVRESIYDQAVSRKNIVASIFYAKHNCPEYKERTEIDVHVVHRQVEERLEKYRQQLSLPPTSTKDIINSVLGFERRDAQPVPTTPTTPTTDDNHHD